MIYKIIAAVGDTASFIWSLPMPIRVPVIGVLAIGIPTVTISLIGAGAGVIISAGPFALAFALVWLASKYL